MNYKELLFEFLENEINREYCLPIVEGLLNVSNIDKQKMNTK